MLCLLPRAGDRISLGQADAQAVPGASCVLGLSCRQAMCWAPVTRPWKRGCDLLSPQPSPTSSFPPAGLKAPFWETSNQHRAEPQALEGEGEGTSHQSHLASE